MVTHRSNNGIRGRRFAILTLCVAVLAACSSRQADTPPPEQDCATPSDCNDPACRASPACQPMCGNGKLEPGESCDDGNLVDGDGCDHNCKPTGCGNGVVTAGEACDDGNLIDGDGCDHNCKPTGCGNGVINVGEACDDGNLIDGDGCDHNCKPTGCGNGVVTAGEACDDGNLIDGDGCDHNCQPTGCGNGVVTAGETCDDGNLVDGDGCDHNCTPTGCGNGIITAGEACDDGNRIDGDGCNHDCTISVCGNGKLETSEACDDGNRIDGDGCDHNCTITACGNGIVTAGEACDDGNPVDGDGCDHNCTVTACGNGIVTAGEACDDGNPVDGDGCDHNCTVTACGNGVVTAGESCDDGNLVDGDGCDHNCTVTACGNGIVTRGEDCEDGNRIDGDGCDASCHFTACPGEVPVAPGAGGSFPIAGAITKLIADPTNCFLYALDTASPSHLYVISTATKRVLTRVTLFEDATDFAISASGAYFVISYATNAIGVIDTARWQPATRAPTFASPFTVAVIDPGIAFYGEFESMFHRIDLRDGTGDGPGLTFLRSPQLATSRDGHLLYVGEWGTTGAELVKYDVTSGAPVLGETSTIGFDDPPRGLYVAPGGQHVYYADHQFDAGSLASIRGSTGEPIYAEDVAGTFAVGAHHVFDADLVRPVATLPHTVTAAALTAGDHELWYYSPDTGQIYYQDPQDLIGGVAFGVREIAPAPLTAYRFAELLHDPVRPRLYGVDTDQAVVVVIDDTTLQPTRAIVVGSTPRDIDIDAAGTTLFVAHDDVTAFARIRLDTSSFDGFVSTRRFPARLAVAGGGRLVIVDLQQFNTPMLVDAVTGAVVSTAGQVAGGVPAATADGGTVFIGWSDVSPGMMVRYSLASGGLVETQSSTALLEGPQFPVVVVPDGSAVFYTGHQLNGHDLSLVPHSFDGPILAVTPDGRRALSAQSVYDVATGTRLGALPATASAVAISPDGTKAFLSSSDGALRSVDLTAF